METPPLPGEPGLLAPTQKYPSVQEPSSSTGAGSPSPVYPGAETPSPGSPGGPTSPSGYSAGPAPPYPGAPAPATFPAAQPGPYSGTPQWPGQSPQSYRQPGQGGYPQRAGFPPQAPLKLKKGLAITCLVFGVLSFFTLSLLFVGATAGIIIGIVAIVKSRNNPNEYAGKGVAATGIVLNVLSYGVSVVVLVVLFNWGAKNLGTPAAHEIMAAGFLATIASQEVNYYNLHRRYASSEELTRAGGIELTGHKFGYIFNVNSTDETFEATASPERYGSNGTGVRSFYISKDMILRGGDKHGEDASADDPQIR